MSQQGLLMVVFALTTLVAYFALQPSERAREISKRAAEIRRRQVKTHTLEDEDLAAPFSERILMPILDSLAALAERAMPGTMLSRLRLRLVEAGRPCRVERLIAMKILASLAVVFFYAALVLPGAPASRRPLTILAAIVSGLVAFIIPDFWLSTKAGQRKALMRRYLADVLDLLSVSVEAGLGFDGAVQKVSEKFKEPVSGEYKEYFADVRLGKSRAEALRNLARRADFPEMQSFVASVIQADHLGVSLSNVLRVQAESLRLKRKQRAEEQAMQAPVKMLFPLIFLIFPTLFLVLLGPVVIHWLTTLRSIGS